MLVCAGCCTDPECPCVKRCDERFCERHDAADTQRWAAYFGLREGMTREERREQIAQFEPMERP